MQTVINKSNIEFAHKIAKEQGSGEFNCWGATLYALDIEKRLQWIGQNDMWDFLDDNTREIQTDIKKGDILCLYDGYGLIHTAIYISKGKYWHKLGGEHSEYTNLEGVLDRYGEDYTTYEIRRLIRKV